MLPEETSKLKVGAGYAEIWEIYHLVFSAKESPVLKKGIKTWAQASGSQKRNVAVRPVYRWIQMIQKT